MDNKSILKQIDINNISLRQLNRLLLIEKLKSFYIDKQIKEGKLISKKEFYESINTMLSDFKKTLLSNITSETQIKNIINTLYEDDSEDNKISKLKNHFKKQNLATKCEIAYNKKNVKLQNIEFKYKEEFNKELWKDINSILNLNSNETEQQYKKIIIDYIDIDEDIIWDTIYEIKTICEYKIVLAFIVSCNDIGQLPQRDRKKLYEEKRKFERYKNKAIYYLKKLNLSYEEVKQKKFKSPKLKNWHNYQQTLKYYKGILFYALTNECKTGVKRAKKITKILDFVS